MAHGDASEPRRDQVHESVGDADLFDRHRAVRKEIPRRLARGDDGVPEGERDLREGEEQRAVPEFLGGGRSKGREPQAEGIAQIREVQLPEERIPDTESHDDEGPGHDPLPSQGEQQRRGHGGENPPGRAVRGHVLAEREEREGDAEPELEPAHDFFRHTPRDDIEQPGRGQQQHGRADDEAAAGEHPRRQLLGEHDRGHGLERLHGHRNPVEETRRDLHRPKEDAHARRVEARGRDERDEQRKISADVAKGTGELMAVEAQPGPGARRGETRVHS